MTKWIFISLLISSFLLGACRPQADNEPPAVPVGGEVEPEETLAPQLILKPNALLEQHGNWVLEAESVELQERQAGLILTARYREMTTQAIGAITLTVYYQPTEAQTVFDERVASWQTDSQNRVIRYSTLADNAYVLNDIQQGVALVDGNGVAAVEFAEQAPPTRWDLLALLQLGVNTIRERTPDMEAQGRLTDIFALEAQSTPSE